MLLKLLKAQLHKLRSKFGLHILSKSSTQLCTVESGASGAELMKCLKTDIFIFITSFSKIKTNGKI